ncbi:MAG TPA: hypothetical protein PK413_18665 [Thermoanaerobaculia bacterium]|nr:hypothetical protein [Thermoanaerobaculia bacterium]
MSSRASAAALLFALAGLLGACASSSWLERADDAFAAGDCASAVPAYERALWHGPATSRSERVYFRLGLCYVRPGNPLASASRAREAFRQVIWGAPASDYAMAAQLSLHLLDRIAELETTTAGLEARLGATEPPSGSDLSPSAAPAQAQPCPKACPRERTSCVTELKAKSDELEKLRRALQEVLAVDLKSHPPPGARP